MHSTKIQYENGNETLLRDENEDSSLNKLGK